MEKVSFSLNIDNLLLDYIKNIAKKNYRNTGAQIEKILYDYMIKNQDADKQHLDNK